MPGPGRNQLCPCGSGRKVKRCCGEHRGPSEDQLASAHLATLSHDAADLLAGLSDEALDTLWENLFDLPTTDIALHVRLPQLITPNSNDSATRSPTTNPTTAGMSSRS